MEFVGRELMCCATKTCNKCGVDKGYHEFRRHKGNKDGHAYSCKSCHDKRNLEYYHTTEGLISRIYNGQKQRSKKNSLGIMGYTKEELINWCNNNIAFNLLFAYWMTNGFKQNDTPSIDRLDDYKGYSFDNIRVVTWEENNKKAKRDRKNGINNKGSKGVVQMDMNGNFITEYFSISEAHRQTGVAISSIAHNAKGNYKQAGGFTWKYK